MSIEIDVNNPALRVPMMAAGRSFLAGFVVNVLRTGLSSTMNLTKGVAGGVLSAAASLIDAAIRPMIAKFFQGNPDTEAVQIVSRFVVVVALLSAAVTAGAPSLGMTLGIDLMASIVCAVALNFFAGPTGVNYPVVLT